MKRIASSKSASRGQLTAHGKTLATAKQSLNQAIDSALEGSYAPALVTFGDYSILVFREITGWCHQMFGPLRELVTQGVNDVNPTTFLATNDRDEAIQSAAHHVIDLAGMDYHEDSEIPAFLTDRRKRADILSSCQWQRAYKFAKEHINGPSTDHDWHQWACSHSRDEMFA